MVVAVGRADRPLLDRNRLGLSRRVIRSPGTSHRVRNRRVRVGLNLLGMSPLVLLAKIRADPNPVDPIRATRIQLLRFRVGRVRGTKIQVARDQGRAGQAW